MAAENNLARDAALVRTIVWHETAVDPPETGCYLAFWTRDREMSVVELVWHRFELIWCTPERLGVATPDYWAELPAPPKGA